MINGVKWYEDGMGVNWGYGRTPRKNPNAVSILKNRGAHYIQVYICSIEWQSLQFCI